MNRGRTQNFYGWTSFGLLSTLKYFKTQLAVLEGLFGWKVDDFSIRYMEIVFHWSHTSKNLNRNDPIKYTGWSNFGSQAEDQNLRFFAYRGGAILITGPLATPKFSLICNYFPQWMHINIFKVYRVYNQIGTSSPWASSENCSTVMGGRGWGGGSLWFPLNVVKAEAAVLIWLSFPPCSLDNDGQQIFMIKARLKTFFVG